MKRKSTQKEFNTNLQRSKSRIIGTGSILIVFKSTSAPRRSSRFYWVHPYSESILYRYTDTKYHSDQIKVSREMFQSHYSVSVFATKTTKIGTYFEHRTALTAILRKWINCALYESTSLLYQPHNPPSRLGMVQKFRKAGSVLEHWMMTFKIKLLVV